MRTAEISFTESSKACTCKIKILGEGEVDKESNDKALDEAKRLYEEGRKFSGLHTMKKM